MTPKKQPEDLTRARRIVVKIGSSLLADAERGTIRRQWLEAMIDDVAECRARGQEVALVSSGAVAVGRRHLGFADGELRLEEKQAAAATGMIRLAHAYQELLARHGVTVAQVLLTLQDTENRRRYLNSRNTLNTLMSLGAVPLINENDTVATEELRFGDNDRLAARVADMISADVLVLLSDVDGLYTANPFENPDAAHIPVVDDITSEIESMAGAARGFGSGGMITKLAAAKICMAGGVRMALIDGGGLHPLKRLAAGCRATWFVPSSNHRTARKRWIAGSMNPVGSLTLDSGAVAALGKGRSLLPAGVRAVEGAFQRGDTVIVLAPDGTEVARGLCAYSAEDARRIIGHKSREIEAILGYRGRDEIIHRDDLVLNREGLS